MKKGFAILFILVVFVCCLWSCGRKSEYARAQEAKKESIYQKGYDAGYEQGYHDAMRKAPERIESYVDEDIWDLCREIENKYGLSPEDAVIILSNYADDSDEVTEEDVTKAIWAIYSYYYDSNSIMYGIEDYWID